MGATRRWNFLSRGAASAWAQACSAATHRVVGRASRPHGLLVRACMRGEPPWNPPGHATPNLQAAQSHSRGGNAAARAASLSQAQLYLWLYWRSSHEELRYGGRSRLVDREESHKAVVRRGHQHHAIEAVSTSIVSIFPTA
eukprot:scaffold54299_cov60-Phaeocystis_antarctica.AAC.1